MSAIDMLFAQPLVIRLGWTLLHFVWQGAVVAVFLAIALQALRSRTSNPRYAVTCVALILVAAMPFGTFALIGSPHRAVGVTPLPSTGPESPETAGPAPGEGPLSESAPEWQPPGSAVDLAGGRPLRVDVRVAAADAAALAPPLRQRISAMLEPFLPEVVALWLVGVFVLSLRLLGGWLQAQRLKRRRIRPVTAGLASARFRISRPSGMPSARTSGS